MLLGAQLRQLREASGVSREDAGYHIRGSESKISRMELGKVSFKARDIADLLTLYGITEDDQRTPLLSLAREANHPGWWHRYNDLLPSWFQAYLGLEAATARIRTYEVQFIPGLLQTPDYARAVVRLGHGGAAPDEVERRVQVRMERQQILTRDRPPHLWVVVDEAALRRPIGGPRVMHDQLTALIGATKLANVRLQVIPFNAGGHAATGGAFSILRFPEQDLPDIVYVEQLTSALYLDKREDVEAYAEAMERLCIEAEPLARTPDILHRILRDIDAVEG
jgi:transcriptional regulator with XRE-family HTH domain